MDGSRDSSIPLAFGLLRASGRAAHLPYYRLAFSSPPNKGQIKAEIVFHGERWTQWSCLHESNSKSSREKQGAYQTYAVHRAFDRPLRFVGELLAEAKDSRVRANTIGPALAL